jgi:hypothetical protein
VLANMADPVTTAEARRLFNLHTRATRPPHATSTGQT